MEMSIPEFGPKFPGSGYLCRGGGGGGGASRFQKITKIAKSPKSPKSPKITKIAKIFACGALKNTQKTQNLHAYVCKCAKPMRQRKVKNHQNRKNFRLRRYEKCT